MQGYEYTYNVTNVEYTEFDRLGVADECLEGSQYSRYPANTNVLYIGLEVSLPLQSIQSFPVCGCLQTVLSKGASSPADQCASLEI